MQFRLFSRLTRIKRRAGFACVAGFIVLLIGGVEFNAAMPLERIWGVQPVLAQANTAHLSVHHAIQTNDSTVVNNMNALSSIAAKPATRTPTPTRTPTATATGTATNTPTATSTEAPTDTSTPTATSVDTETPTDTPTETSTPTATGVDTETPTDTPTETPTTISGMTETPTGTPIDTPTSADTPTETPTPTASGGTTETPTDTPTDMPTSIDTPTDTSTPTATPLPGTATNTPAATATTAGGTVATNTPTVATNTPTAAGTATKAPTSTATTVGGTGGTNTPAPTVTPTEVGGTGGTNTPTPTLPASDATAVVTPGQPASLTYNDPNGGGVTVQVPAGAVNQAITLLYADQGTPSSTGAFQFAGHTFTLTAYRNNNPLTSFTFQQPITIVIDYTDADVAGLDETTLTVFYYDVANGVWTDQGITVLARDLVNSRITIQVNHLTEFALGATNHIHLPLINR